MLKHQIKEQQRLEQLEQQQLREQGQQKSRRRAKAQIKIIYKKKQGRSFELMEGID